jgi:plasmid stability protein
MCAACANVQRMSKMIQIRNVPDRIHHKLKVKAARMGVTLSALLLEEAERLAEQPTLAEVYQRILRRSPVKESEEGVVEMIHAARGERGR